VASQPSDQTVTAGQSATFSVVAAGTAPLSYQWQQGGVSISGATSASYSTGVTKTSDSGSSFRVVVSNSAGHVTGNAATLIVNAEPQTIAFGPIGSQAEGTAFALSAAASSGLPVSFTSTTLSVCDVSSITTTLIGTGTCTIQATQPGNSTYAAATAVSQDFMVTAQTSYYVSTTGSDSASGSEWDPFMTLGRAQTAMQRSSSIKTVQIFTGTYYLSSTLALTAADNGETWEPVADAMVVLSGGQVLTGWTNQGNGIYSTNAAQPVGLDLSIAGVRQTPADLGYDPDMPYITGWRVVDPNMTNTTGTTITVLPADLTASVKAEPRCRCSTMCDGATTSQALLVWMQPTTRLR
jgi:hypothetical protein